MRVPVTQAKIAKDCGQDQNRNDPFDDVCRGAIPPATVVGIICRRVAVILSCRQVVWTCHDHLDRTTLETGDRLISLQDTERM